MNIGAPLSAKNTLLTDRTKKQTKIGVKRKYPFDEEIRAANATKSSGKRPMTGKKTTSFVVPQFNPTGALAGTANTENTMAQKPSH